MEIDPSQKALEYNTERSPLMLKEYGRNVQMLVKHIATLEDKDDRTAHARTLLELMKALNPSVRENADNPQRVWDHMYVMADFELDIDSPYPIPPEDVMFQKPQPLPYKDSEVKFRNYGRNVELLIEQAIAIEDAEEQLEAIIQIGHLMKTFYASWNNNNIEDKVIASHLKILSKGEIDLAEELAEANGDLFGKVSSRSTRSNSQQSRSSNNNNRGRSNSNNRNNKRRNSGGTTRRKKN
ncbi:MAG: hypothetical protein ACJAWV_000853 [Flammeovirgaceae bacterium]|jgi:hypothetical protein